MNHKDIKSMELKAIKMVAGHDDSHSYTANVYINGKKAIEVSNDGWGGPDSQFELVDGALDAANEYCKRNGKAILYDFAVERGDEDPVNWSDLESWCNDQVNEHLLTKEVKKRLKNNFAYVDIDGEVAMYPLKQKGGLWPLSKMKEAVAKKEGRELAVLNDMPFEKAYAIFKKEMVTEYDPGGSIIFMPEFDDEGCTNIPIEELAVKPPGMTR